MPRKSKAVLTRTQNLFQGRAKKAGAGMDISENSAELAAFKNALTKAPKDVLERIILEESQSDGRVANIFWSRLVATDGGTAKHETCRHCKQGFDTTENDQDSCVWHYGNLTVDENVWVDYYEDDRGPIGSKENRKQLPQGFFWDCCGLQLNSAGCLKTEHAPATFLTRNERTLNDLPSERTEARRCSEVHDRDASGPPPSKKRKMESADASAQTKCRNCGELYDESNNTERVCSWHDVDAVRRFTGEREGWESDEDGDQCYSENEEEEDEDDEDSKGRTIQWTCCGSKDKDGEGCLLTPHLPPRTREPKVRAVV
ncbi:hypothetical protein C8R43DRAFT_514800 [Mycena crocata]|nr:hypothetical protein C8R43DRAFT_514800 [Mycena crocata]